jgi:peptidoglycan/LPS O-acetylase OafA/YrhL
VPGEGKALPESSYRGDIQGLRAVAVLLVALNHAGIAFLAGGYIGVDVFFVVSGFLITGLLLRDRALTGRISLLEFYSRRARRILPAAALTLVATDIAAWLLLNYVRAQEAVTDSIWAAFFAANIQFERIGADYFASAQPPSPIQHYWSLAVEEQFYLVWPALLIALFAAYALIRRARGLPKAAKDGGSPLALVLAVLGVVVVASLAWSIRQTEVSPADAYFSALTRAWELGMGAALAVGAPLVGRLPATVKAALSWAGLAGILVAATWFTAATPFPGLAAMLPVAATALVVAGGTGGSPRFGAVALLGLRPFRFVGDLSYSFYLWHWPFLIIAADYAVRPLGTGVNLGLLGAAFVTSVVTYHLYENPLRRSRSIWGKSSLRPLILWPASLLAVVMVGILALSSLRDVAVAADAKSAAASSAATADSVAAVAASVALAQKNAPLPGSLNPPVDHLDVDYNALLGLGAGCVLLATTTLTKNQICTIGDPHASRTLVVVGDSIAHMWLPALNRIAQQQGWKLIPFIYFDCTAKHWGGSSTDNPNCTAWFNWAAGQVNAIHPGIVVLSSFDGGAERDWTSGLQFAVRAVQPSGARIVLMEDVPGVAQNPVDCLLAPGATMKTCTSSLLPQTIAYDGLEKGIAASNGASYIEVLPWFCSSGLCPTVIGSTIAYRNQAHITFIYALQLSGPLATALHLDQK